MSRKRKTIVISIASIAILAIISLGLVFLFNSISPKTYTSVKKECKKVLDKYQVQMEKIAVDSLESGKNVSGDFKEYFYSCHFEEGLVNFNIDAQGMLGGQYWELVYSENGTFYDEAESYLYEQAGGNNIMKAERLNEHWWFLWTDYDGTDKSYQ